MHLSYMRNLEVLNWSNQSLLKVNQTSGAKLKYLLHVVSVSMLILEFFLLVDNNDHLILHAPFWN